MSRRLPPEMEEAAEAKRREFEAAIAAESGGGGGEGGGAPRGPRTVVCYICGCEFGRSSIEIHERQCARKWEDSEAQKPPGERRPLPSRPEVQQGATREERNEAARAAHAEQAMAHCQGCGRRFKDEETLRKHQRSCRAVGGALGQPGAFGGAGGRQLPPEMEAAAEAQQREFEAKMAAEGGAGGGAGGGGGKPKGPRTVVCYICGREFGRTSIGIHEKQCAQKWEEAEAQKPPRERKPLPQRPEVADGATREERNEAARAVHEAQAMAHCPGCARSFKDEDTLRRHMTGCHACGGGGGGGGRRLPPEMEAAAEAQRREFEAKLAAEGGGAGGGGGAGAAKPSGPRTVVCCICGREFGRTSIGIHEKQCERKWEETEAQKPPHERKPLPQRPDVAEGATREERNDAARAAHEAQAMAHCPSCGRSFKDEDTLRRHMKGCHAKAAQDGTFGSGGRRLPPEMEAAAEAQRREFEAKLAAEGGGAGGGGGPAKPSGPRTVVCYICGREFGKTSIGIHEKQCARKWEDAEAQKPPHERKPLPERPEVQDGASREERNEAARAVHEAQGKAHCPGCGRRFKDEETLRKHQRSCRAGGEALGPPGAFGGTGGRRLPPEMEAAAEAQQREFEAKMAAEGGGSGDAAAGRPKGPRTVVCYICGREFGRSSIGIHEKQCAQKWEEAEARKPPGERKPLPQRPEVGEGATREERNEAARAVHEAQAMAHCPACGRTFKDAETLKKHAKSCTGRSSSVPGAGRRAGSRGHAQRVRAQGTSCVLELFSAFDRDNSGAIDPEEFEMAMQAFAAVGEAMGFEVDYSFATMDKDRSGGVDLEEFEEALLPLQEIVGASRFSAVVAALIRGAEDGPA